MREILFKGKRVDNGEWIEGNYEWYHKPPKHIISNPYTGETKGVISETVGQYTGLKDKNGNKIFEGDIVQWTDELNTYKSSVEYCGDKYNYPAFDLVKHDYECNGLQFIHEDCCIEVIGNVFDYNLEDFR